MRCRTTHRLRICAGHFKKIMLLCFAFTMAIAVSGRAGVNLETVKGESLAAASSLLFDAVGRPSLPTDPTVVGVTAGRWFRLTAAVQQKRGVHMFKLSSSAFEPGARIPKKYTGEGADVSPALSWTGVPAGTAEFALIGDDPDAPRKEPWVHWVLYKIPADLTSLSEGRADGAVEGKNDFGRKGYGGPMPPRGHGVHHYHFKLYALDQPLKLTKPGASKADVLKAMQGHIIGEAELTGTYER